MRPISPFLAQVLLVTYCSIVYCVCGVCRLKCFGVVNGVIFSI
jgi:hypothetical protein